MKTTLRWALGCTMIVASCAQATNVDGIVRLGDRPAADSVVYLECKDAPAEGPRDTPMSVMDQKNLSFVPRVLPVLRGTTVHFINSDDIQHNVFSPSTIGHLDLGTYGPGAMRSVTLDEVGEMVILCNIHMEMQAHIVVLPQPYFALTGADGRFHIADVPHGDCTAKVWSGKFRSGQQILSVPTAGDLTVDLRVEP